MLIPRVTIKHLNKDRSQLEWRNPGGCRRRLRVPTSIARECAFKVERALLQGKNPEVEMNKERRQQERQDGQLREFWPYFEKEHVKTLRPNTQRLYSYLWSTISGYQIAQLSLVEINRRAISQYQQQRKGKVKVATINRETSLLKSILGKAVEWGILDRDPRPTIKLLKENNRRDVSNIRPEQIMVLLESLPGPVANICSFALHTGIRKESILSLEIDRVQIPDIGNIGIIRFEQKGGDFVVKQVGPQAVKILQEAIGNRTEGYVFLSPRGGRYISIHKAFDRHVRRLGIVIPDGSKFCFHDWRRLYATWMLNAGRNIEEVRDALGQKSNAVAERYATFVAGEPWEPVLRKEG